jgi:hypothetical protein
MSKVATLKEFEARHPHPDQAGISRLYKFLRFNDEHPERLRHLLVKKRLYLSPSRDLNDPFECRPHWSWPNSASQAKAIRDRLIKVARRNGAKTRDAERYASRSISNKELFSKTIKDVIAKNFGIARLCSFTSSIDNILLWSHYANSHKGLCIEFDAEQLPIASAMKVHYQDNYPSVDYPMPDDARGFAAVLTKSRVWEYENEFRLLLVPSAPEQHPNDGESYCLSGGEITSIYLGAEVSDAHRQQLLSLVTEGKLSATIYQAELSDSSYALIFKEVHA